MKRYDTYKDSGVLWIGEIPSHWLIGRMKFTGKFDNGLTYSPNNVVDDNGYLVLRSTNIQNSKLDFEDCVFVDNATEDLLVKQGDIIICSRNGSANLVGKCALVNKVLDKTTFGAFMMRYRPTMDYDFAFFMFQSATSYYKGLFSTTTINQLTIGIIGQMSAIVPPLKEQKEIASYLKNQLNSIDKLIATQQRRIELLQELRQSIITRAVTHGINPDAPMRPSGIDWIGDIPAHWETKKLKYSCKMFGRIGFRGYSQADLVAEGEGAITLSPTNMNSFTVDYSKCSYLTWKKYYESPEIMVKVGDVLLVKTASVGKCSYVDKLPCECTVNPQILVLKEHKDNPIFLTHLLSTPIGQTYIQLNKIGSTIPTLSEDKIGKFIFAFPPLAEQQEIVDYIERETAKVDATIGKAERQIALLQELRQSVITEVVTGKRKVC